MLCAEHPVAAGECGVVTRYPLPERATLEIEAGTMPDLIRGRRFPSEHGARFVVVKADAKRIRSSRRDQRGGHHFHALQSANEAIVGKV